jgi:uncharacterized protein (UPF0335 family)
VARLRLDILGRHRLSRRPTIYLDGRAALARAFLHARVKNMVADVADSGVAADELRQFIERIERLEEEKAGIASDIKDVFAELKGRGFDAKAVRQIVRLRKQDHSERQEQEAILELYMQALGMS